MIIIISLKKKIIIIIANIDLVGRVKKKMIKNDKKFGTLEKLTIKKQTSCKLIYNMMMITLKQKCWAYNIRLIISREIDREGLREWKKNGREN